MLEHLDNVDLSITDDHGRIVSTTHHILYSEIQEGTIANSGVRRDRLIPLNGRKAGRDYT